MIHWTYVVFGIGLIFLLYQSFRSHNDGDGGYFDFSVFINMFWSLVTIIWIAVWGGILWW